MTYDQWWDANWAEVATDIADRTFGEEVWKAAQAAKEDDDVPES